jgi:hypothetical protein
VQALRMRPVEAVKPMTNWHLRASALWMPLRKIVRRSPAARRLYTPFPQGTPAADISPQYPIKTL